MKIVYLPKTSILLQFGGKITVLCPDDSIQILLILSQFLTFLQEMLLQCFICCLVLSFVKKKKKKKEILPTIIGSGATFPEGIEGHMQKLQ